MELPLNPAQWGVLGILLGVVVWVIYALLKGKLVPRRYLDDVRKDRDERLRDSLEIIASWKDAVDKRDQVIAEILPTMNEIKDLARLNNNLIDALKTAVRHQPVGGHDVS